MQRIMVDMSATILHHGHVRLMKKAKELGGTVIIALSRDDAVEGSKGYTPELTYDQRAEILYAIRYVDEVVPTDWLVDNDFLIKHNIDLLVHGDDNVNDVPKDKLKIFPRTQGISSSLIRQRVLNTIVQMNTNNKQNDTTQLFAKTMIEFISKEFKLD